MRWPWQRREETAPQLGLPARRDDAAPISPMGWAFLPPLQRQVGDMPLVARTADFPAHLPAWQNPSFTGTLAHRVSTDAPSGVIDGDGGGTGEPTRRSSTPDLTLLSPAPVRPSPVQRAVAPVPSPADISPAVREPLTTSAPTGLPVLSVPSYDGPAEPDPTPGTATGDVPTDADPATDPDGLSDEGPVPASVVDAPAAGLPTVQRSAVVDAARTTSPGAPTQAAGAPRASVAGRRLGLGAPLPAMPLVSDVPPVQRSTTLPPALGNEGADGYVEVDIPSGSSRPGPAVEASPEPDVPTLGPASPPGEEISAAPSSPGTTVSAGPPPGARSSPPPAMPMAALQRSLSESTDTSVAEPSGPTGGRPDDVAGHDVPATTVGDGPDGAGGPAAADQPVLAQRSVASTVDTPATTGNGPDVSRSPAGDDLRSLREPGPTLSDGGGPPGAPSLRRAAPGRPTDGGDVTWQRSSDRGGELTLQRSVEASPATVAAAGGATPDQVPTSDQPPTSDQVPTSDQPPTSDQVPTSDQIPTVDEAPLLEHGLAGVPAGPSAASLGTPADGIDAADAPSSPASSPMVLAATRPMLGTAEPLTARASTSVQRSVDGAEPNVEAGSRVSAPVLTRRSTHTATVGAAVPRSWSGHRAVGHPQLPGVQRAVVGGHLQGSVGSVSDLGRRSSSGGPTTTPPGTSAPGWTGPPSVDGGAPALPLATPAIGAEPTVQTALADESAAGVTTVSEAAAGEPESTTVSAQVSRSEAAPTSSPSGGDAPGAAGAAAGASSPEQLEALAGRLFAPLMRRIRSEMLLDRERRGLRTDSW